MSGAGEALAEAAMAALRAVDGLNAVYDGPPLPAAFPYAAVEAGPESDWSHKSGAGRELRLAILLRDQGERPARLRGLAGAAEAAAGADRAGPGRLAAGHPGLPAQRLAARARAQHGPRRSNIARGC